MTRSLELERTQTDDLDRVISGEGLRTVFQPIVDLDTKAVLGYEALTRGPEGSALESPVDLFAEAESRGKTSDLDWACASAAMDKALDGGIPQPLTLFSNLEVTTAISDFPSPLPTPFIRSLSELRIVFEITERALADHPAELLRRVAFLREFGCGIALDDVGADSRSIALMSLIRPDVIKLDLRLLSPQATTEAAVIAGAVQLYAETTGAAVLAEGIEKPEDEFTARALGATLGQGYLYGRPAPLPAPIETPDRAIRLIPCHSQKLTSPRDLVEHRTVRVGRHALLVAISRQMEAFAAGLDREGLLVAAFQTSSRFTEATRARYSQLAGHMGFVAALAEDLEEAPATGVCGGPLSPGDPLVQEWTVAVIGPFIAAALVAIEVEPDGDDRRFEFQVTYDRREVVDVARVLLERLV